MNILKMPIQLPPPGSPDTYQCFDCKNQYPKEMMEYTHRDTQGVLVCCQCHTKDKPKVEGKEGVSMNSDEDKDLTPFTIYLNKKGHLIAPCAECGEMFSVVDDELEFDRDSNETFCRSCEEKLQHEAEQERAAMNAEYYHAVAGSLR